ncbi:unknown [Eubacterium sp. CAG:161]|nr:unknown [Eubacterium sp. CAG:161]
MFEVVLETITDAESDAKSRVGKHKYKKVKSTQSKWVLGTNNYNQSLFNKDYKRNNGIDINRTCSEVATTILTEYYNRKEKCVIRKGDKTGNYVDWEPYFNQYVNIAYYDLKIYTPSEGTYTSKICKLFKPFYKEYKKI